MRPNPSCAPGASRQEGLREARGLSGGPFGRRTHKRTAGGERKGQEEAQARGGPGEPGGLWGAPAAARSRQREPRRSHSGPGPTCGRVAMATERAAPVTRGLLSRDEGELLKGPRPGKMLAAALPRALCRSAWRCPVGLARPRPAWHSRARQERGGNGGGAGFSRWRWARPGGAALAFLGGEARRAAGGLGWAGPGQAAVTSGPQLSPSFPGTTARRTARTPLSSY